MIVVTCFVMIELSGAFQSPRVEHEQRYLVSDNESDTTSPKSSSALRDAFPLYGNHSEFSGVFPSFADGSKDVRRVTRHKRMKLVNGTKRRKRRKTNKTHIEEESEQNQQTQTCVPMNYVDFQLWCCIALYLVGIVVILYMTSKVVRA